MTNESQKVRALCLLSGGLNSQLAVCLLKDQGVEAQGITFTHPLCTVSAAAAAIRLNVPHHVETLAPEFLELLVHVDEKGTDLTRVCMRYQKALLQRARELMHEFGCRMLCTGTVLNGPGGCGAPARYEKLDRVAHCRKLVVRPLSAHALPATIAEEKGWVDRAALVAVAEATPGNLAELAERYGLPPSGEAAEQTLAFTQEPAFTARLRDLRAHEGLHGIKALGLLRIGRHFRLGEHAKLVMGRNEDENARIEGMTELHDLLLTTEDVAGPSALLPFTATDDEIQKAAAICLRYSGAREQSSGRVRVRAAKSTTSIDVRPARPEEAERSRIDEAG